MSCENGIQSSQTKIPRFCAQGRVEAINAIQSFFDSNIEPTAERMVATQYLCIQYDAEIVKLILHREFGFIPQLIPIDNETFFIKSHRTEKNDPDYRGYEMESLLLRCNIPYICVSSRAGKFSFLQYNQGIPEEINNGFFYRPDLGFAPKSSWEANVARVLKYLSVPYEYEKKGFQRFPVNDRDTSTNSYYFPDFFLTNNRIVEIKGFWDDDSRAKVLEFIRRYSNYRFFIIDYDMYPTIVRLYGDVVSGWEKIAYAFSTETTVQVVGITYGSRSAAVQKISLGQPVLLQRDFQNKFDPNAILVRTGDGEEIGFLSADWACIYAPKMDIGMEFSAKVAEIGSQKIDIQITRVNGDVDILHDFLI